MAGQEKWYFSREQLQNSPSRKCFLDADKELAYRQQAANLIQDMGQRLQVSQLCINTAIVYMHRFYAFHSFTQFHRNAIAAAALFLAAKVEEQPRKLEYVIKVAHVCLHRGESASTLTSEQYQEQAQDLVFNENVLLQTLGFDVAIDHPHTHVVRTCHLVKAPKDLAQTSYFMASNSLHLTTMCLQYRPTVVACFCIHLASKWSNWAIPQSNEGRHWFSYVDRSVTSELLERLTSEFLHIFDKCPSRLRKKMMNMSNNSGSSPHSSVPPHSSSSAVASPFQKAKPAIAANDELDKSFDREYEREKRRPQVPGGYVPATTAAPTPTTTATKIDYNLYREKREREERERRNQMQQQRPPAQPPQRPNPAPHHPRPNQHHKPHHNWPHKVPHHKVAHEHRPRPQPSQTSQPTNQNSHTSQPAPTLPQTTPQPNENTQNSQRTRPPSLFSPENSTTPSVAAATAPRRPVQNPKPLPKPIHKPTPEVSNAVREMQPPAIISPFSSPPPKEPVKQSRPRLPSNSEPELIPVVKKLEETPGFENVIRDSQRGTIKANKIVDHKRSEPVRSLNGIETDPTLVSNLLKESLARPAPITVQTEKKSPLVVENIRPKIPEPAPIPAAPLLPLSDMIVTPQLPPMIMTDDVEHKHKKDKKKKEKHKHKDRDKSKEERKKHKKDKDKEKKRELHQLQVPPQPVPVVPPQQIPSEEFKITIPKEKLSSPGLKIKIPKDRLAAPIPPPSSSGIKIKIPKEVLETSRKRVGENDSGPPNKMARQNGGPHPHKVGNHYNNNNVNNNNRLWGPPMPYYVMQPPPSYFFGGYNAHLGVPEYNHHYNYPPPHMYHGPPHAMPNPQPPLPSLPPPAVPPPPPE